MDDDEFRDAVNALAAKSEMDPMQVASVLGELSNRYADRAVTEAAQ